MSLGGYLRALVTKRTSPEIAAAESRAAEALHALEAVRAAETEDRAKALRALDAAALYARRIAQETPALGVRVVSIPDV